MSTGVAKEHFIINNFTGGKIYRSNDNNNGCSLDLTLDLCNYPFKLETKSKNNRTNNEETFCGSKYYKVTTSDTLYSVKCSVVIYVYSSLEVDYCKLSSSPACLSHSDMCTLCYAFNYEANFKSPKLNNLLCNC